MLVWRGGGIIVPIIIFIAGLIVMWTAGITDARVGNPHFMGWTFFWSSIVISLIGLATVMSGKDEQTGRRSWTHHTFFWIPIMIWGVILGIASGYILIVLDKPAEPTLSSSDLAGLVTEGEETAEEAAPAERVMHFYNPTKDTLFIEVADSDAVSADNEDGVIERKKVPPHETYESSYRSGSYIFAAFKTNGDITFLLPGKNAGDKDERFQYYEGSDANYAHRILDDPTKEGDDYDEAWLSLDGKTGYMLVNVTTACAADATKESIAKANWADAVQEEYPGNDLVEPLYKQFLKDKNVRVVGPGQKLPTDIAKNDTYYLLIPKVGSMDNKAITSAILKARF